MLKSYNDHWSQLCNKKQFTERVLAPGIFFYAVNVVTLSKY